MDIRTGIDGCETMATWLRADTAPILRAARSIEKCPFRGACRFSCLRPLCVNENNVPLRLIITHEHQQRPGRGPSSVKGSAAQAWVGETGEQDVDV